MVTENYQNISLAPQKSAQSTATAELPARRSGPYTCNLDVIHGYSPRVATALGLVAASLLFILHLWMKNPNAGYQHDGRKWLWNGYLEWQKQMPWLSLRQVGEAFRKLERLGILISCNYHNNPYDRRKWYTIDYQCLWELTGWNPFNFRFCENPTMENASHTDALSKSRTNINSKDPDNDPKTTRENVDVLEDNQDDGFDPAALVARVEALTPSPNPQLEDSSVSPTNAPESTNPTSPVTCYPKPQKASPEPKIPAVRQSKTANPEAEAIRRCLQQAGIGSATLYQLALGYSLEVVEKALTLLESQRRSVKNPAGWLSKCLRGKWWQRAATKPAAPVKPWEAEFTPWYAWAIAEGIVEDWPVNYLSTDGRGEPIVRLKQPDRFTGAPYTSQPWRSAREQFVMPTEGGPGDGETRFSVSGEVKNSIPEESLSYPLASHHSRENEPPNPVESLTENPIPNESPRPPVPKNPTPPDYSHFPWQPKNGWRPGANREYQRQQKAEWCRTQLLKVASDDQLAALSQQLGETATACIAWVDAHLLLPQEVSARLSRLQTNRTCQQQTLFDKSLRPGFE
ncbi:MAG: hypothetical protein SWY16_04525 [Cyanobacteriota bacterium]|nr:hypothetical protein [Cyanobacteriota bacterium]